jgi:hypothetical protein
MEPRTRRNEAPFGGGIVGPLRYAQSCTMGPVLVNVLRHKLGLGLLLLRLVVAVAILSRDAGSNLVETVAAFLLLGGLWTSTVGAIITLIEGWALVLGSGGWVSVLIAAITSALALVGPGPWSVDAQLRGWHRIEIPPRESDGKARPS